MITKIIEFANQRLAVASGLCVLLILLSTIVDVIGRSLFNSPIIGVMQLCRMLLLFAAFLGLGYTQLQKQHIRVEFFFRLRSKGAIAIIDGVAFLLAAGVMAVISYAAFVAAYGATMAGESEIDGIKWPLWPGRIALAVGCVMLCLQFVVDIIARFRFSSQDRAQER